MTMPFEGGKEGKAMFLVVSAKTVATTFFDVLAVKYPRVSYGLVTYMMLNQHLNASFTRLCLETPLNIAYWRKRSEPEHMFASSQYSVSDVR